MIFMLQNPQIARAASEVPPLEAGPDGRPLTLVFSDNFRSFRPWTREGGVWRIALGDGFERGGDPPRSPRGDRSVDKREFGFEEPDPVVVKKSVLENAAVPALAGTKATAATYPYISGLISTEPSFSQTYGYFEMRAQLPEGKGLWPAFWMLPVDQTWPPEIDIVESVGDPNCVYMTAHSKFGETQGIEARITANTFHTFAVSWDPRRLIWYIDAAEAGHMPTPEDMHKPMYLLANLAVGANRYGSTHADAPHPAELMVDFIRAYRFNSLE